MPMKLIVGLGNPGREYERTRHNVGFVVVDELARRWGFEVRKTKFHARTGGGAAEGQSVLLMKPQTYMNRSGLAVGEALGFYQVAAEDLLVVVDDMALELGQLRLRGQGSAGGHNGLKDIIAALGHQNFARLRIGIGAGGPDAVNHVLSVFSPTEQEACEAAVQRGTDAAICWLSEGMDAAMNKYNQKSQAESDE